MRELIGHPALRLLAHKQVVRLELLEAMGEGVVVPPIDGPEHIPGNTVTDHRCYLQEAPCVFGQSAHPSEQEILQCCGHLDPLLPGLPDYLPLGPTEYPNLEQIACDFFSKKGVTFGLLSDELGEFLRKSVGPETLFHQREGIRPRQGGEMQRSDIRTAGPGQL